MAKPLPWIFPFVIERQPEDHPLGRTVLRPLVVARLIGPATTGSKALAIVDSGSEHTLAAPWMARELGIEPQEGGREVPIQIGGNTHTADFTEVRVRLCPPESSVLGDDPPCTSETGLEWQAEVGFFRHWTGAYSLLFGQCGFFDQFTVTMNRQAQALAVEAWHTFDERFPD